MRRLAKDRRINKCPIVADAASIRTDAGSVSHDSYCCADPNAQEPWLGSARVGSPDIYPAREAGVWWFKVHFSPLRNEL